MIKHELTDSDLEILHAEWRERIHARDEQVFIRIANLWYYTVGILNSREVKNGAN